MGVAEHGEAGLAVFAVEGPRLDAASAEGFRMALRRRIDRSERHIAVDLGRVEFMDSTGLGALVGCLKYMGEGGSIELVNPGEQVMKVLRLTRMDRVFPVRGGAAS